jgi:hypothetical protein
MTALTLQTCVVQLDTGGQHLLRTPYIVKNHFALGLGIWGKKHLNIPTYSLVLKLFDLGDSTAFCLSYLPFSAPAWHECNGGWPTPTTGEDQMGDCAKAWLLPVLPLVQS